MTFAQTWTFQPGAFTNPRHDTELTLSAGAYRFEATGRASLERGTPAGNRPGLLTGAPVAMHEWQEVAVVNAGVVDFIADKEARYRVQPGEPGTVLVFSL